MSQFNRPRATAGAFPDPFDLTDTNFLLMILLLVNFALWLFAAYRILTFLYG